MSGGPLSMRTLRRVTRATGVDVVDGWASGYEYVVTPADGSTDLVYDLRTRTMLGPVDEVQRARAAAQWATVPEWVKNPPPPAHLSDDRTVDAWRSYLYSVHG